MCVWGEGGGGGEGGSSNFFQSKLKLSEIPWIPTYFIGGGGGGGLGVGASNFFPRGWSPIAKR